MSEDACHVLPPCSVCAERIGACRDVDLGAVCGDCKAILIIMEFDLKQIVEATGIEFCVPLPTAFNYRNINRHIT